MTGYSLKHTDNRAAFRDGARDGVPIGLGYLAVAFSLGIAAKHAGLTPAQGFVVSFLCSASAGEYVGFTLIGAAATYLEIALATLVANARYILMSCALSQRVKPGTPFLHRLGVAFGITDEIFGASIARPGYLNPWHNYGAMAVAIPLWSVGTMLGVIAGNLLPLRLVSAFSVALYGMFLAIIIPPARKSRILTGIILLCFAASYGAAHLPVICELAEGTRTILLTVLIAGGAAILFPREEEET